MLKTFKNLNIKTNLLTLGLIASYSTMAEIPENPVCDDAGEGDQLVSYHFNDIDLASVMMLVGNAASKEIKGMELLQGKKVSSSANCVDSIEFAVALLLVNGFDLNSDGDKWVITKS